jgi:alpha-L-fucosidase
MRLPPLFPLAVLLLAPQDKPAQAAPTAAAMPEAGLTREQRIQWWREAKFGMFIHWGLYSIPAGVWKDKVHTTGYSEWIMFGEKIPAKEYEQLAGRFNPVEFDAMAWAAIAKKAGMKYMVLTTKHHDGFSMFKSRLTPYNVVDATPFKRDVTRELSEACRDSGIRFGCYYSTGIGPRALETATSRTMSGITPIPRRRISTDTFPRLRSPRSRNS